MTVLETVLETLVEAMLCCTSLSHVCNYLIYDIYIYYYPYIFSGGVEEKVCLKRLIMEAHLLGCL